MNGQLKILYQLRFALSFPEVYITQLLFSILPKKDPSPGLVFHIFDSKIWGGNQEGEEKLFRKFADYTPLVLSPVHITCLIKMVYVLSLNIFYQCKALAFKK